MVVLKREFKTPDKEMKKIVLKVWEVWEGAPAGSISMGGGRSWWSSSGSSRR